MEQSHQMTAHQFYQKVHGSDTTFLNIDAIEALMEAYADHRFEEYRKVSEKFNTERLIIKKKDKENK